MVILMNYSPPTEGIRHEQPKTKAIKAGVEVGIGTLFIAESLLSWRNDATGDGFSVLWPMIGVSALSRDGDNVGEEGNVYIQVTKSEGDGFNTDDCESDFSDCEGDPDFEKTVEIKFIPEDKNSLDVIYQALSDCQDMCPDPPAGMIEDEFLDADEDDDDAGEYILAGGDSGFVDGMHNLAISNGCSLHHANMESDGQFEDAEDEED